MRVLIAGDSPPAKALRGYLARHDFHLTTHSPDFTVRVEEDPAAIRPLVESIHGELDQAVLRHLRKQTATPIEVHRARSVASDREVRIVAPASEPERRAVEVSVFRALLELSGQRKRKWWKILRKTK